MKCPKCQYISFDSPDRCRNCGYDFSLASGSVAPVDPVLQRGGDADGPWPDLSLKDGSATPSAPAAPSAPTPSQRSRARTDRLDLPLFNEPVPGLDDTPLISSPSTPRAPLAVRKATPDPSRVPRPSNRANRPARAPEPTPAPPAPPQAPTPEWGRTADMPLAGWAREGLAVDPPDFPPVAEPAPVRVEPAPARQAAPVVEAEDSQPGTAAPSGARLLAGLVDGVLLVAIDAVVLYFTLAILRYPWSRLLELPLLPLVAFCLMLNAGYVVAFTVASGQTIGKMLAHVRVVTEESWRVPVTQAVIRTAIAALSLLPLGLGYLPAFIGKDRRALHDRLSNTRVVRA